ncbi:MAG: hypothetical protein ACI912_001710, partial [Marinobacter psychrophilus]
MSGLSTVACLYACGPGCLQISPSSLISRRTLEASNQNAFVVEHGGDHPA